MEELKEFMKLNIIPFIMIVITMVIACISEEIIRKVLLGILLILLVIHAVRCANYIDKQKRGE